MSSKNILLLVADDLGKQLGCYGSTNPKTPNIDQLAAEGTKFTRAFASTASCSGSRSTIYTGLHTHQNGQYGLTNGKFHFTCFDTVDSAPSIFARHGYLTSIVGKVHVGPNRVFPWEIKEESDTRDVRWVADRASDVFETAKEQDRPFFLTIGYIDPHRDLTRGGFGNNDAFPADIVKKTYETTEVEVPPWLSDLPGVRQELASYYEAVNRMDQGVGMVIAALEQAGLTDDTLVVFLSDNGSPFINSKTTLYDAGVNLPMIVRVPGSRGDVTNTNLVSYVDVLPTLIDWAGKGQQNARPSGRLGRSFLGLLGREDQLPDWTKVYGSHTFHEITNYWPTRYVRTTKYKYHRNIAWRLDFPFAADIYGSISWEDIRDAEKNPLKMVGNRPLKDYLIRPAEELYDLEKDPNEVENVASDPAYESVLTDLRKDLENWQMQSDDLWLFRDGVSVYLTKHHMASGMRIPDRFDLDLDNLGSKGCGTQPYQDPWARQGRS